MKTLRPKFKCDAINQNPQGDQPPTFNISLYAVQGKSEENNQVFRGNAIGRVILSGLNKSYAEAFEQGKEYYLDLVPVN